MNIFGKVLAILTTFLCVSFLGFAFVARIAGTNWDGEAAALEHYYVERTINDQGTTYTVKNKHTGEAVKKDSKVLPDVLIAAYQDEANKSDEKYKDLKDIPANFKQQLDAVVALQKLDTKAMELREQELLAEFERLAKELETLSVEKRRIAGEAKVVWDEGELRREDVSRMRVHLEELEIDLFQMQEQKKRLQDELSRLQGVLSRLQRRQTQLRSAAAYEPNAK